MHRSRDRRRSGQAFGSYRGASGSLLDLDYVNNRYFGRTLAQHIGGRVSTAFTPDADGFYHLTQPTELRRTNAGFLLEHGSTNSVLNSWLQGAAVGLPGTLPNGWAASAPTGTTLSVENIDVFKGLPVIDLRLKGTATGGGFQVRFGGLSDIAAGSGQNWVCSAFLQLLERTNLNDLGLTIQALNNSSVGVASNDTGNIFSDLGEWSRPYASLVGTPLGTTKIVGLLASGQDFSGGVELDELIRIAVPQVEQWDPLISDEPFPTTPIKTTGVAAARDFEHAHVSLDGLGLTDEFTCIVIGRMPPGVRKLGTHVQFSSANAMPHHVLGMRTANDGTHMEIHVIAFDETPTLRANVPLPAPGTRFCGAFSVKGNAIALSINGGSVNSLVSTHPVLDGYVSMFICGTWGGVHQAEAPVERIIVLPGQVSDGDLSSYSIASRWDA